MWPRLCLSLSLELLGEDDEAREVVEQSLAGQNDPVRLRRRLIDLYVKHDRRKEALDQVSLLPAETPHRDALRSAVRGACLAAQKNWVAARAYLQTAYDSGCRDALCLRWLSVALVSTGDLAAAEPILRQWQAAQPGIAEPKRYLDMIAAGQNPVPGRIGFLRRRQRPASPRRAAAGDTGKMSPLSLLRRHRPSGIVESGLPDE